MDTDIDLLVQSVERDLATDTFADITPASYVMVMPEVIPGGEPGEPDTLVGNLILRFQDVNLDADTRERIFRRARMSANEAVILERAMAALQANLNDIQQDQGIISDAQTVEATSGSLTAAQLSNYVRGLARAARLQAQNDINSKRELNALIRLVARRLESTE